MKEWKRLTTLNEYLNQNQEKGVKAFEALFEKVKEANAAYVVLSFTYENIEAYVKINGRFELYQQFFGVLSQYQLDQLSSYDYDENDPIQDYKYWKFNSLKWELIEIWMVDCFDLANGKEAAKDTKYYFKHNHDSLKILALDSCDVQFEKSEFEVYIKNNKHNVLDLLT